MIHTHFGPAPRGRAAVKAAGSAAVASAALALFAAGATAQSRAPSYTGTDLVAPPTTDWPTNGGNWYNQRYSPLDEIDRDNVANLRGIWRVRLGGSGVGTKYSGEAQPLVHDGVVYVVTGADDVFAISVETGEILWSYEADLDPRNDVVCCGWTSRGVGLGDGRVYVGQLDGRLVALDQTTGRVVWRVQAERWQDGYSITSAPLYYDGLVITGFAGAEYGVRGRVKAFDAATGEPVWTFYTVPGPGEPGHDTWPADNEIWRHGGGTVWQTPAVDPELGLLYFSTGNPGPDYNGAVREGDNLFTASIVAVDAATGEYRWHFQQVHHDLWDYDAPNPVILFDVELNGELRRGLAQAGKTGWVYLLDRETGAPLVGIEERPVPQEPRQATAATQPFPIGDAFVPQSIAIAPEGFTLVNEGRIFTPFWTDEYVVAKPAIDGGANWPPSAYDPEAGHMFVCAADLVSAFIAEDIDAARPPPGELYVGGEFGSVTMPVLGTLTAIDVRTNRIVWQKQWADDCYSGVTATAGGLLFVGRNDGRLSAFDSSTGNSLWEFQTGAGMNAPVTVFEHDGREHVVAYSAGNLFAGSPKGDSVWLFALDGDIGPVPAAREVMSFPESAAGTADVVAGQAVYEAACVFCHGETATGGHGGGPTLMEAGETGAIVQAVTEGRGDMPPFGAALTPEQIRDVAAYLAELIERQ